MNGEGGKLREVKEPYVTEILLKFAYWDTRGGCFTEGSNLFIKGNEKEC